MHQALHILRKDVRHLYLEILLVWVLAFVLAWIGGGLAEVLLLATSAFLIGRLIHAEPIPGDRQFWITRPYRWRSLAGAKLAFVVSFIAVPVCLAQLAMVWKAGFPLAHSLPGLLWSQVLLLLCAWVPIAALATVTSSTPAFLSVAVFPIAAGLMGTGLPFLNRPWPGGLEWVRTVAAGAVFAAAAAWVCFWQYRQRRTTGSRALAAGAAVASVCAYVLLPWPPAYRLQSWLAPQPSDGASLRVTLNPVLFQPAPRFGAPALFHLPLTIGGVPAGDEVRIDVAAVTIESRDGRRWKQNLFSMRSLSAKDGSTQYDGGFPMEPALLEAVKSQPVTVRASVYLTLFGRAREKTAVIGEAAAVTVADGLRCFRDRFGVVYCQSVFRWPGELVYAKLTDTILNPIDTLISYAPFPAGFGLDPIETHWASGPPLSAPEVTLVMKEPLAFVRRDVEAREVRVTNGFSFRGQTERF